MFELAPSRLLICCRPRLHARQCRENFESSFESAFRLFSSSFPAPRSCALSGSSPLPIASKSIYLPAISCVHFNLELTAVDPWRKSDTRNAPGWGLAGSFSPSGGLFRVETGVKPPASGGTFLTHAIQSAADLAEIRLRLQPARVGSARRLNRHRLNIYPPITFASRS